MTLGPDAAVCFSVFRALTRPSLLKHAQSSGYQEQMGFGISDAAGQSSARADGYSGPAGSQQ